MANGKARNDQKVSNGTKLRSKIADLGRVYFKYIGITYLHVNDNKVYGRKILVDQNQLFVYTSLV